MTAHSHAAERVLPRGWGHLALQFAIWIGFYGAYQVARGAADQSVDQAFDNGQRIIDAQRSLGSMIELPLQHAVEASSFLVHATSYTYWLSQFAVVGIALLWTYFRAHESFFRFRNTLILANLIGLAGYVLFPTAPPRMFPEAGFTDTLARHSTVTHESTIVEFAANPYAAMPSLHSADALIVGVVMALTVRSRWAKALWLAWPVWVWISVMGTGNHFWLDIAAGVVVAAVAAAVVYRGRLLRRLRPA
jgi:membrane-associated phospholipid phosphatase